MDIVDRIIRARENFVTSTGQSPNVCKLHPDDAAALCNWVSERSPGHPSPVGTTVMGMQIREDHTVTNIEPAVE